MKWKCEIEYRRKQYELVEGIHCKKCDLYRACGSGLSRKITRFCQFYISERPLAWREKKAGKEQK